MEAMGEAVVAEIEALAARLEALTDLRPRPEVNRAFDDLVHLVLTTPDANALDNPVVQRLRPRLQELSARGEHELERAWSAADDIAGFPYLDHYRQLVAAELAAVGPAPQRVLFVGSGPLPLSPMLLADHGLTVDALDVDPDAVAAAEKVANNVRFRVGNLLHQHDLAGYDLVVLAALVTEKDRCLRHLAQRLVPGTLVAARSALGLRTLLYPSVELPPGLQLIDAVHPPPPVINSIVLARVSG